MKNRITKSRKIKTIMRKISILIILVTFGLVGTLRAQFPNDNLVGYWPFNGNAYDESGNGNDGVVNGATLTADRFGNINSAYNFDGINDYILVNDTSILNPDNFSMCCWYKTVSFEGIGNNAIVEKPFSSHIAPNYQYHIGVTGDLYTGSSKSRFVADVSIDSMDRRINTEDNFLDIGEWYFLCITYNGLSYKFYVDDLLIGDSTISGTIDDFSQDLFIGRYGNIPYFTPGVIDDIRIYNKALTSNEVDALYNETPCTTQSINDTSIFYVSNYEFQSISPRHLLVKTDTLKSMVCACDSIVSRYEKFVYEDNFWTDTLTVIDSISVTDTLIIDVILTDIEPPYNLNTIKIYPNPANEFVIINTENYLQMGNYTISIFNSLGQPVFVNSIDQQEFQINVNEFGGYGTYFVKVYENNGDVIETRKLILQ